MNNQNINPLDLAASTVISALRHSAGTFTYYDNCLSRLFSAVLDNADTLGMSNNEAMNTLQCLHHLRQDLAALAGKIETPKEDTEYRDPDCSECAAEEFLKALKIAEQESAEEESRLKKDSDSDSDSDTDPDHDNPPYTEN